MADSDEPLTALVATSIGVSALGTVASTMMSAKSIAAQGRMSAQTATLNSQLLAREQISQAQVAEYQAQLAEREAQASEYAAVAEREAGKFDVARQREQGTALLAQQRAEVGGAGLEATGSPLLVMAENAKQLELDRLAMTHASETRARALEEEARMSRHGGELATYQARQLREGIPLGLEIGRYQARAARYGARLGVASTLISGGGRLIGQATPYALQLAESLKRKD